MALSGTEDEIRKVALSYKVSYEKVLMPGSDLAHPASISDEVFRLAPRIEYLKFWKSEGRAYSALVARDFLKRNTAD